MNTSSNSTRILCNAATSGKQWLITIVIVFALPFAMPYAQNAGGAVGGGSPGGATLPAGAPAGAGPVGVAPIPPPSSTLVQASGIPGGSRTFSPSAPTVDPRTNQPFSSSSGSRLPLPSALTVDPRTGQSFSPANTLPGFSPSATGRMFSPNSQFTPNNSHFSTSSRLDYGANLGVVFDAQGNRLQISSLDSNALGAAAGFQVGDQVLGVDRVWATSPQAWQDQLTTTLQREGQAWVAVNRNGARQWVNVDPSGRSRGLLGVHVFDDGGIVRISQVSPGSVAWRAGLQAGDVILAANGAPLTSNAQLTELARTAAAGNGEINFVVRRGGYEQTLQANLRQNEVALENGGHPVPAPSPGGESAALLSMQGLMQLRNKSERLRSTLRNLLDESGTAPGKNSAEAKAIATELLQTLEALDRPRQ